MWFEKIVGQKKINKSLTQSVMDNTLSHALILEGQEGYGGLPVALSLAELLLCSEQSKSGSCGTCRSCQQVANLIHPDLHFAFPVVKKDGKERKNTTSKDFLSTWRGSVLENPYLTYNEWIRTIAKTTANGDINVKECTDIIQQLNFQAFSGGKKVQLIWVADQLGSNGNKLLKLIEEPPDGTFLLLVCTSLDSILQTIISRCRVIRLPRIEEEDVISTLMSQLSIEHEAAGQIAFLSGGDFSLAMSYTHIENDDFLSIVMTWLDNCYQKDFYELRQWSIEFSRYNSEEQKAILNYLLKLLQSLIYNKVIGPESMRIGVRDKKRVLSNPSLMSLSIDNVEDLSSLVSQMITEINRYVSGRMVMFNGSLQISKMNLGHVGV